MIGVAALVPGGCASGPFASAAGHLADGRHPWHAVPYSVGAGVVLVPLWIVTLPIALVLPGGDDVHTSPVNAVIAPPAIAVGTVVGGAFYVVGYPLELAFPVEEEASKSAARVKPSESAAPTH